MFYCFALCFPPLGTVFVSSNVDCDILHPCHTVCLLILSYFRLGRLQQGGAKGPGLFFVMPCIDSWKKVDLRTVSFDVPPQEVMLIPGSGHSFSQFCHPRSSPGILSQSVWMPWSTTGSATPPWSPSGTDFADLTFHFV